MTHSVETDPVTGVTTGDRVSWTSALGKPRRGIVVQIQEHDGTCVATMHVPDVGIATVPCQFLVVGEDLGPQSSVSPAMIAALDPSVFNYHGSRSW